MDSPANSLLLNQIAELVRQGRLDEAEKACRQAVVAMPGQSEVWAYLGMICLLQMKLPEAEQCLGQAVALNPERADYWSNLAVALRSQRRPEESEWYARRSLMLDDSQ